VLPFAYLLPFLIGQPFDRCMAFALPGAAFGGWLVAVGRAPLAGLVTLLLSPALWVLFSRYPPLTSPTGAAVLVAAPVAVVWIARLRGAAGERRVIQYLATVAVSGPLIALGLYHYFLFAPGPHSLGQWALALGPAALGVFVGLVVSSLASAIESGGVP